MLLVENCILISAPSHQEHMCLIQLKKELFYNVIWTTFDVSGELISVSWLICVTLPSLRKRVSHHKSPVEKRGWCIQTVPWHSEIWFWEAIHAVIPKQSDSIHIESREKNKRQKTKRQKLAPQLSERVLMIDDKLFPLSKLKLTTVAHWNWHKCHCRLHIYFQSWDQHQDQDFYRWLVNAANWLQTYDWWANC